MKNLSLKKIQFQQSFSMSIIFNPFLANIPIFHPLKTSANLWSSVVFWGYKMETTARKGLKHAMKIFWEPPELLLKP